MLWKQLCYGSLCFWKMSRLIICNDLLINALMIHQLRTRMFGFSNGLPEPFHENLPWRGWWLQKVPDRMPIEHQMLQIYNRVSKWKRPKSRRMLLGTWIQRLEGLPGTGPDLRTKILSKYQQSMIVKYKQGWNICEQLMDPGLTLDLGQNAPRIAKVANNQGSDIATIQSPNMVELIVKDWTLRSRIATFKNAPSLVSL